MSEHFCFRRNDTIKRGRIYCSIDGVNARLSDLLFMKVAPLSPKKKEEEVKKESVASEACRGLEFRFWGFINREEGRFIPPLFRFRGNAGRSITRISVPLPLQAEKIQHPILFNAQAMEHRFRFHPRDKIFPRYRVKYKEWDLLVAKTLMSPVVTRILSLSLFSYGSVLCLLWNERLVKGILDIEIKQDCSSSLEYSVSRLLIEKDTPWEWKDEHFEEVKIHSELILGWMNRISHDPPRDRSSLFHALPHKMLHGLPPSTSLSIWLAGAVHEAGLGGAKSRGKINNNPIVGWRGIFLEEEISHINPSSESWKSHRRDFDRRKFQTISLRSEFSQ